jgi:hypothetical protein
MQSAASHIEEDICCMVRQVAEKVPLSLLSPVKLNLEFAF